MTIFSLMQKRFSLQLLEVEVSFMPGLPQIQIMGLPDTMIKESAARIRSALRHQGFSFPRAKQVLVHLRPGHIKKNSRGLDLAIASALLWESGQVPRPPEDQIVIVYGELTLKGQVLCPDQYLDIEVAAERSSGREIVLWTGQSTVSVEAAAAAAAAAANVKSSVQSCNLLHGVDAVVRLQNLSDLRNSSPLQEAIKIITKRKNESSASSLLSAAADSEPIEHGCRRRLIGRSKNELNESFRFIEGMEFPQFKADLLSVCAAGEHSLLIAGPQGVGKTCAAYALYKLLEEPSPELTWEIRRVQRNYNYNNINKYSYINKSDKNNDLQDFKKIMRPLIQPHHSMTSLALVGGGNPPQPGEITRAHGGMLLLDEFLEFSPSVQEALREPMESGYVRVARGTSVEEFPAQFMTVATTNLCPCGGFLPSNLSCQNSSSQDFFSVRPQTAPCHCRRYRRQVYLSKLRGPVVDRFSCVEFFMTNAHASKTQKGRGSDELVYSFHQIDQRVRAAIDFRRKTRGQDYPNEYLDEDTVMSFAQKHEARDSGGGFLFSSALGLNCEMSWRRKLSLWRVARTCADLEQSAEIEARHLMMSEVWTMRNFASLKHANEE